MKKIIFAYIAILIGLFVILSFMDRNGDYQAERDLWKINAKFAEYTKDPKIIPTGSFDDIRKRYNQFIKNHPNSKLVPLAELHIGHTYMAMKEYDNARKYFEDLIHKYSNDKLLGVQAAVEITRTYALEEDEKGVVKSYERVIRDFPLTDVGIKTPILMVEFFKNTNNRARMQKALEDAEKHYEDLIKDHPNTMIELKSLRMLVDCHMFRSDFKGALQTLESMLLKFPDPGLLNMQKADNIIKIINTLSIVQLKDYDQPIRIYTAFVEKYPNHPYVNSFKSLIAKFKVLKEQNVGVVVKEQE